MEDKLHIAALIPYPVFPAKMGGQKGIALFYTHLSRIAKLTLIGTADNLPPPELKESFIPALSEKRSRYFDLSLIKKIGRIIRERQITHLIAEHPYYAWLVLMLKRTTGVKLIVHSHNIESLRFKNTGKWWWGIMWHYERSLHRAADLNFFISDEDRRYATEKFGLNRRKCITITYGFELNTTPSATERVMCRKKLEETYGIDPSERILFFNGTLSYGPNLDALMTIVDKINPILLEQNFSYKILICGKGLPDSFDKLKQYREKNIIYAGFVDDIGMLFKGSDIFINPVNGGGGIKTKLVEALGFGLTCISTRTGAIGVPAEITAGKLIVVGDDDITGFADAVISADVSENIPPAFFEHFAWDNIVLKAKDAIINFT